MDTQGIISDCRERAASARRIGLSDCTAIVLEAAADRLEQLDAVSRQPPEKYPAAKPPFVVWSPDGETPPKVSHSTHRSAHHAAHKMAERHEGRTFYVMARSGRAIVALARSNDQSQKD